MKQTVPLTAIQMGPVLAVCYDDVKKKSFLAEGILKIHMHTENRLPSLSELCSEFLREISLDWVSAVRLMMRRRKRVSLLK